LDDYKKIWVYIGSGKYYSSVDQTDTSQQIFLGLKHDSTISYPTTTANLNNRTNTTVTGTVTGTTQVCMFDTVANDFANKTLVISINRSSAFVAPSPVGWYINLDTSPTGERVISRPFAIVDFLIYKPNADACAAGGDSYLYSLGYTTGVAPENIAILHPDITGGSTSGTVTVAKRVKLGPGAPPTGEAIVVPPQKDDKKQLEKKIQVATGVVVETKNETPIDVENRVIHWLKK
jgi:Tfp pilus tip-associated adhesin PilY1